MEQIRDLIRSTSNKSDNYHEKDRKIKDDNLPLKKTIKLYNIVKVVRSVVHEGNKYYP